MQLHVRRRLDAPAGIVRLWLGHQDDSPLPAWQPGAHIAIVMELAGAVSLRYYSLTADPAVRDRYELAIRLEDDATSGSHWIGDHLQVGSTVQIRLPRNNFPMHAADSYVFVAGGIGITPLLPMAIEASRRQVPWELLYGGRDRESMPFLPELRALAADSPQRAQLRVLPEPEFGVLPLEELETPRAGAHVFSCGPESLLDAVEDATVAWPDGTVHLERYAPRRTPRRQRPDR